MSRSSQEWQMQANNLREQVIVMQNQRDEARQRIAALEQQLAASEAGAGVMRKALTNERDWLACLLAEAPDQLRIRYDRIVSVLATDHGKAAAEKLARYEAALRAILTSDDNDLGTFAQTCETVAREALEGK